MDQQLHFITLATPDLDAARRFYCDGLGWTALLDVSGEIIFFQVAPGLVLGLFDAKKFVDDINGAVTGASTTGVTLAHNVDSQESVNAVVDAALAAGASLVKAPQRAAFGGYHGHIADPNGVVWEICYNSGWSIDKTGRVHLTAIAE
jgi:catechol 2,3-dioxygenase-like lactoylglutathione lyase family enzyme